MKIFDTFGKRSEFGKTLVRFASAQILSNFLRLLSGFLVVRAIDPTLYGEYTGVGVYLGYILLGQGGIINGLGRELPMELGKGNDKHARDLASSVFILSIFIGAVVSIIFLAFSLNFFIKGEALTGMIYLSYAIIGGLYLFNNQFLSALYRTNKDFNSLSRQNIRFGIGNLISVILVYLFGIYGLLARGVILALYQFLLLFKNKPYKLSFRYETSHFKKLFRTGIPIFGVGYINSLWATIMNNIIFSVGGATYFGYYALSSIVQGVIGIIPASFSGVIYPRMTIMLGEGKSIQDILKSNLKALTFQFLVMLMIAFCCAVSLPFIIPIILPKYVSGITAAQWMCFVPVAMSFGAMNNIYNVIKKQFWYFISLITGAIIGSLFVIIQVHLKGFYLVVFPQGLLLGYTIQQFLSLLFIRIFIINRS